MASLYHFLVAPGMLIVLFWDYLLIITFYSHILDTLDRTTYIHILIN